MPIIGKVNATPFECRVENMEIGTSGYIYIDEIIITKLSIFVDLTAQVVFEDDDEDTIGDFWAFLPIKRIGPGLKEEDFELDFSRSDESDLAINPRSLDIILGKEKENYLVFTNFDIGVNNPGDETQPKTRLEQLNSKLQDALDEDTTESYDRAAKIRGQIAEEKQKTENKDK